MGKMSKSEVYSWRLSPKLKTELEAAARAENTNVSALLERLAREWLDTRRPSEEEDAEQQRVLRERIVKAAGKFSADIGSATWAVTSATLAQRALDPGFLVAIAIALLFLWGVLSPRTAPWAVLYRTAVAPRLAPPTELEDPRPPRFAQGVGLFVAVIGLVLQLIGVPWALAIAAAMAFVAAFLNAAFGLCLGCQLYLLLQRVGLIGRARPASA